MKILLTGASGFLGEYILQQTKIEQHEFLSVGREKSNSIVCDLSKEIPKIPSEDLSLVIHAAGKAHINPKTNEEIKAFFDVNLQGTKNLIAGIDASNSKIKHFVFISTVAVYGKEYGENITEKDALRGKSPYAKSKIEAEQYLTEWSEKANVSLLILRLPLLIGNQPKGNLLKMINGIRTSKYISIGKGTAQKSMVMAEDVVNCIFAHYDKSGIYNLTDGYHPSFRELELLIASQLGKKIRYRIPISIAKLMGAIGNFIPKSPVNSELIKKMSLPLVFNDDKAREELNWKPNKVIDSFKINPVSVSK